MTDRRQERTTASHGDAPTVLHATGANVGGRSRSLSTLLFAAVVGVGSAVVSAQETNPKPTTPPAQPAQPTQPTQPAGGAPATSPATPAGAKEATPPKPAADPPKSLDDLLGLPSAAPTKPADGTGAAPADDPARRQAQERLDRGLTEKELDSLLQQALAGMKLSAEQLGERTDTGLSTQRVQQDVVAKLDQLIEEAKRRCKNGSPGSSGSSSSGQSGQQQQKQGAQKQGDAQGAAPGESKSRDGKRSTKGDGTNEGEAPAPIDPDADQAALDETQAEWGALPDRVRDLIRQGSRDRIASLYQRLTQEYYRRMAEDASR